MTLNRDILYDIREDANRKIEELFSSNSYLSKYEIASVVHQNLIWFIDKKPIDANVTLDDRGLAIAKRMTGIKMYQGKFEIIRAGRFEVLDDLEYSAKENKIRDEVEKHLYS